MTAREFAFLSYDHDSVDEVIMALGLRTDDMGNLSNEDGQVCCEFCETRLTRDTLGNALPGSALYTCQNTACFAEYVTRKLL